MQTPALPRAGARRLPAPQPVVGATVLKVNKLQVARPGILEDICRQQVVVAEHNGPIRLHAGAKLLCACACARPGVRTRAHDEHNTTAWLRLIRTASAPRRARHERGCGCNLNVPLGMRQIDRAVISGFLGACWKGRRFRPLHPLRQLRP